MLKIAVCDDEEYVLKDIDKYIRQYAAEKQIEIETDLFCSSREIIALGIDTVRYDVFFLDVEMGNINGIEAARSIRTYSEIAFIIFVTAHLDYSLEGYEVNAERYVIKDVKTLRANIFRCLDVVIEKMNHATPVRIFRFRECEKEVRVERILYIESYKHIVEFFIMEQELKTYSIYTTLDEIQRELSEYDFARIHKSILVNLKHVVDIRNRKVFLNNGMELNVSKSKFSGAKAEFVRYKGRS